MRAAFRLAEHLQVSWSVIAENLNRALRELGVVDVSTPADLERTHAALANELGGAEANARLAALGALRAEAQQLGVATELGPLTDALAAALEDVNREMATRSEAVLTDLLLQARDAIRDRAMDQCPVCEQDINRAQVILRLTERIEADKRISAARKIVADRRRELVRRVSALVQSMNRFIEHWTRDLGSTLPPEYSQTAALLADLERDLGREGVESKALRECAERLAATVASNVPVIAVIEQKILEEGGGERRGKVMLALGIVEAAQTDWPKLAAATDRADALGRAFSTASRLHGHAVEARKSTAQTIISGVASLANSLYGKIHPDEQIDTSSLEVRDVGHGSINLSAEFFGHAEPPLLHYSESHLDTLGLCYFLAFRRREAELMPAFKVLVLDDVMHSVDAAHRTRVARLLKTEFGDHQIIITTHDDYFYDALSRDLANGFERIRITNWTLDGGPVLGEALTDRARILDPTSWDSRSAADLAGIGGRFFEPLLREATEAVVALIPARFSRPYEIGQLWPALRDRLKGHKGYAEMYSGLIDGLDQNAWVRNACGAHSNAPPAPVTHPEAREFAGLLASLDRSLFCESCGEFVSRQSNRAWCCPGHHIHYQP